MTPIRRASLAALALFLLVSGAILAARDDSGAGGNQGREGPQVLWLYPARPIPGLEQRMVGRGARGAAVLWREGRQPPRQVVVFLHKWEAVPPWTYREWLRHLAERGTTIVYPAYALPRGTEPEDYLDNALAGIEAALDILGPDPTVVAAVGETTGAALAFDYAAVATEHGLPPPRAVFTAFPGRDPPNGTVTPADLSEIAPGTLLTVVSGPANGLPRGDAQARAQLRGATRVPPARRAYLSAPPNTGPRATNPASRRAFWKPLDRLLAAVRGRP